MKLKNYDLSWDFFFFWFSFVLCVMIGVCTCVTLLVKVKMYNLILGLPYFFYNNNVTVSKLWFSLVQAVVGEGFRVEFILKWIWENEYNFNRHSEKTGITVSADTQKYEMQGQFAEWRIFWHMLRGQYMERMEGSGVEIIGLIQILKGLECHTKKFRSDVIGSWSH